MRSGELCSLQPDNIDFKRGQIILRGKQTKAGYTRVVPIGDDVKDLLDRLCMEAGDHGYLFRTEDGTQQTVNNLQHAFGRLVASLAEAGKLTNSEDVTIHCLRRTYISHLIMAGTDPIKVMAIVGHRQWSTIQRYLCLSDRYVSEVGKLPY
jgi:integrase